MRVTIFKTTVSKTVVFVMIGHCFIATNSLRFYCCQKRWWDIINRLGLNENTLVGIKKKKKIVNATIVCLPLWPSMVRLWSTLFFMIHTIILNQRDDTFFKWTSSSCFKTATTRVFHILTLQKKPVNCICFLKR